MYIQKANGLVVDEGHVLITIKGDAVVLGTLYMIVEMASSRSVAFLVRYVLPLPMMTFYCLSPHYSALMSLNLGCSIFFPYHH